MHLHLSQLFRTMGYSISGMTGRCKYDHGYGEALASTEDCKLVVICKLMQDRNATDKLNPQCSIVIPPQILC